MGDVILVYDEYGKAYYRRLFWMNVLLYVILGIIFVAGLVDLIVIVVIAFSIALVSLVYAFYFISKNPPSLRLFWMNVLLYVILGIIFVAGLADLIVIVVVAFSIALASLVYAFYFISKNPPLEFEQEDE